MKPGEQAEEVNGITDDATIHTIDLNKYAKIPTAESAPVEKEVTGEESKGEEKTTSATDPKFSEEPAPVNTTDDTTVKLDDLMNAEDGADALVEGLDIILAIGGKFAAKYFKLPRLFTVEETHKLEELQGREAIAVDRKEKALFTSSENALLGRMNQFMKMVEQIPFSEKESARLKKAAKRLLKSGNLPLTPGQQFGIVLGSIVADRAADIFLD